MTTDYSSSRVFGLDLLRAFSILCVLFAHGGGFLLRIHPELFVSIRFAGFIGVECFFVLSGYLVGTIAYRSIVDNFNWSIAKVFWVRRWFRTLPNYFLFLFINFILISLGCYPDISLGLSNLSSYFAKYSLFIQNLFEYKNLVFFAESWSLAIEEWFYLLIMLATGVCYKVFKISSRSAFYVATASLILVPLIIRCCFVLNRNITWLESNRIVVAHLDSIAWGVLSAIIIPKLKIDFQKTISALIGVLGIAVITYKFDRLLSSNLLDESFFARILIYPFLSISVALMIPYLLSIKIKQNLVRVLITKISLWSYSLYLINLPVFYLLDKYSMFNAGMNTALFLLISLVFSAIIYRYFESPITKLRSKWS